MRHSLLRIWFATLGLTLLLVPTMGSGDVMSRFNHAGHQMMCICGCGQILLECNHVGCPSSDGMRAELRNALNSGLTEKQVYAQFISKYGPVVMAAPVFQGFNILAWVMPGVVLMVGTFAIALLLYSWKNKSGHFRRSVTAIQESAAEKPALDDEVSDAIRSRIRKETEL